MSSALALTQIFETRWTILKGPARGSVRVMQLPQFTIGRSGECEFVIQDPKCSRRHATIQCGDGFAEVTALAENNPVFVNGRPASHAILRPGDVLTIGESEIAYAAPDAPVGAGAPVTTYRQLHPQSPRRPSPRPSRPRRSPQGFPKRLLIYGLVGLVIWWLFSDNKKKQDAVKIRTEKQIEADIQAAQKLKEAADAISMKRMESSVSARQAQENYVRGFRDYRDGQFERALTSFQACLALNPEHALCNRYLRLSQRRFNELIQYNIVLGRKYRDQNQYKACREAFRNVMVMSKDPNSTIYKEAKANYEACNSFVEGRY